MGAIPIKNNLNNNMLTKYHKFVQRQWIKGSLDLHKVARRLGYKGSAMGKGLLRVRKLLADMGIKIA